MKFCPLEASYDSHLPGASTKISSSSIVLPFLYLLRQFNQDILKHSVGVYHHLFNLVHVNSTKLARKD